MSSFLEEEKQKELTIEIKKKKIAILSIIYSTFLHSASSILTRIVSF